MSPDFIVRAGVEYVLGLFAGGWIIALVTLFLLSLGAVAMGKSATAPDKQFRVLTNPINAMIWAAGEEWLARGFLVGWLGRHIGVLPAIAVSSTLFFALHIPNGKVTVISTVNLYLVSLLFSLIYLRYGLVAVMGVHAGWNIAQWPLFGYPMYGRRVGRRFEVRPRAAEWLSGGQFGPEYSMISSWVMAALIVIITPMVHV